MKPGIVKVSCNLTTKDVEAMRDLAARRGCTMTEVVRRGLDTLKFLYEKQEQGAEILVKPKRGQTRLVILP